MRYNSRFAQLGTSQFLARRIYQAKHFEALMGNWAGKVITHTFGVFGQGARITWDERVELVGMSASGTRLVAYAMDVRPVAHDLFAQFTGEFHLGVCFSSKTDAQKATDDFDQRRKPLRVQ